MIENKEKVRAKVWREAKKKLRRNVRLRLKKGLFEDLREVPKVDPEDTRERTA
jgi:hypothetical protein